MRVEGSPGFCPQPNSLLPPRITGSRTHREGSPAAKASGLAGGRGRSHQPEGDGWSVPSLS